MMNGYTNQQTKEYSKIDDLLSRKEKKFDVDCLPDGPMATSYENYIHNIFRVGNKLPLLPASENKLVSAHAMLRVQDLLGSAALDETLDEDIMKAPMDQMFSEQGLTGIGDYSDISYYPRTPKSSLYESLGSTAFNPTSPFHFKDNYSACRKKDEADWRRNNKQMIVDYKGSDNTPLTPFMYSDHPFVKSQDSRIVGSNFVQITSRPKDSFLEKIDRTLAEVRAMPRY